MFSIFVIPVLVLVILIIAHIKKVNTFASFVEGAKGSLAAAASLLPYLVAMFLMIELLVASGIMATISSSLAPVFGFLGVPEELSLLILMRPFSSSASLTIVSDLYKTHGVDSQISRAASAIMASSDALFFIITVYFIKTKIKKLWLVIPIALISSLVGAVVASLIVQVL